MIIAPQPPSDRLHRRAPSRTRALPTLLALAALVASSSFAQTPTFNAFIKTPKGGESWFQPASAAVGDFNADGRLDALVSDGGPNLRLMLNHGNWTAPNTGFSQSDVSAPGTNPGMIRAADLNGDGRLDAVTVSNGAWPSQVTVVLNTGNVNGVPQLVATNFSGGFNEIRSVSLGDLNGDGKPDMVIGNAHSGLRVFLNSGSGTFALAQSTGIMPNAGNPSVGPGAIVDLNGDGKLDYVVTSTQSDSTNIFFGNGNGTLQAPVVIMSAGATGLAVADVNSDGKPDLLTVNNDLKVFLNNGSGAFGAPTVSALPGANSIAVADINGDGKLDAAVGNAGSNKIQVLLGNGSGAFGTAHDFAANFSPYDAAVGDFNGDGKPDVATVGYGDRTYGVLTNTTVFAPPLQTQTLTILGGSGTVGAVAPNVEYLNPVTNTWQPAYLAQFYNQWNWPVSSHPWGNITGTNQWINYRTDGRSDAGASGSNTLWYLYRVRFTVPADAVEATMNFSLKADNRAQVAINGVSTGSEIEGQANGINADAAFSQSVRPGENTITIRVGDEGGLNGFNFRIDLSVKSAQPLEIVPVPTNRPPVAFAGQDQTVEATSPSGAMVTLNGTGSVDPDNNISSYQWREGATSLGTAATIISGFSVGNHTVTLDVTDAGNLSNSDSIIVNVRDTTAPVITSVPANQTIEATSASGAVATFGGATATDAVGPVTFTYSPASATTFPLGTTTVTVTAKDAYNNTSSGTFKVTVRDTTAPVITSLTASSTSLWPANHKMVAIRLSAAGTDAVSSTVSFSIKSVTSNEPDNGLGDGDTPVDFQITGPMTLNLRAERGGGGNGRIYTITVEAKDEAGNASTSTVTVSVPKSLGGK